MSCACYICWAATQDQFLSWMKIQLLTVAHATYITHVLAACSPGIKTHNLCTSCNQLHALTVNNLLCQDLEKLYPLLLCNKFCCVKVYLMFLILHTSHKTDTVSSSGPAWFTSLTKYQYFHYTNNSLFNRIVTGSRAITCGKNLS